METTADIGRLTLTLRVEASIEIDIPAQGTVRLSIDKVWLGGGGLSKDVDGKHAGHLLMDASETVWLAPDVTLTFVRAHRRKATLRIEAPKEYAIRKNQPQARKIDNR